MLAYTYRLIMLGALACMMLIGFIGTGILVVRGILNLIGLV